jgi:hypothetical protein
LKKLSILPFSAVLLTILFIGTFQATAQIGIQRGDLAGFDRENQKFFIVGTNWRILDYDNNFGGYNRVTNYPEQVKSELAIIGALTQSRNVIVRVGLLDSGYNYFKGEGNYPIIRDDVRAFLSWARDANVMVEFIVADHLLAARYPQALTDPTIRQNITRNFLGNLLGDIKNDSKAYSALWGFDLYDEPEWSVSNISGGGWESVITEKPSQPISIDNMNSYLNEAYYTIKSIAPDKLVTVGISAKYIGLLPIEVKEKLDYFSLHYYPWMGDLNGYIAQIPQDKPWLLEEYPSKDNGVNIDPQTYLDSLWNQWRAGKSASGGFFWTWKPILGPTDDKTSIEMIDKLKDWTANHQNEMAINQTRPTSSVTITYPQNSSKVGSNVTVNGNSQNVSAHQVIWIIVFVPKVGVGYQYYPMSEAAKMQDNGEWSSFTTLGGDKDIGDRFDIIAVIADQTAQEAIRDYISSLTAYNNGSKSNVPGFLPGIATLPAGTVEYNWITITRGDGQNDFGIYALITAIVIAVGIVGFIIFWMKQKSPKTNRDSQPQIVISSKDSEDPSRVLLSLDAGFGAYCVFVPSGFGQTFEQDIIKVLQEWMVKCGKMVHTSTMDITSPAYLEIMRPERWVKRPFIMFAPENEIRLNTFKVVLADLNLMKDINQLQTLLPQLLDLMLMKDFRDAAKQARLSVEGRADVKKLLTKNLGKLAKNIKITISIFGISISAKSD